MESTTTNTNQQNETPEKPARISTKQVFSGKWLKMNFAEYPTRDGKTYTYEYVERTTTKNGVDGTYIVGIMKYPQTKQPPKIILVGNFRPPLDKYVLEFPAGLIDEPKDCLADAIRELKEETGYTPTKVLDVFKTDQVPQVSPALYIDPWKSNESEVLIIVEVDGDDEVNKNVKQNLENTESIVVHLFDISTTLWQDIVKLAKEKDYLIESKLYAFIVGLVLSKQLHLE